VSLAQRNNPIFASKPVRHRGHKDGPLLYDRSPLVLEGVDALCMATAVEAVLRVYDLSVCSIFDLASNNGIRFGSMAPA